MDRIKSRNYNSAQIEAKFREIEEFIRVKLGGEPKVILTKLDETTLTNLVRDCMEEIFRIFTGLPSMICSQIICQEKHLMAQLMAQII